MTLLSDRIPETRNSSNLNQLRQLVDRRLAIAQKGLDEARQHLEAGQIEEVDRVLGNLDEDLHLLRRRLDTTGPVRRPAVRFGPADAMSEAN